MTVASILDRMPHKGAMRLIDSITSVTEQDIHCIGVAHDDDTYPLRIDGRLYAATLVELGAQAAAAHASVADISGHHTGLLIGLQNVELSKTEIPSGDGRLNIVARQLHFDRTGALYSFAITYDGETCVTGRATLRIQGEPV